MLIRNIPFFDYPSLFKKHEKEFMTIIREVCERGAYILQEDLKNFEEGLKEFLAVKHAFGVADGTNALIIGLKALGIGQGGEVILPSHTYIASAASIHLVGGVPVPVDIGEDHLLDPEAVERAITPKTRAIMPVQLNGRTCNMEAIQAVAQKYHLDIVEDAAQGLGSRFKGKCAGTFGSFGTFSFYPAKVLGCFGDGGAIVTDDDQIAEFIYKFRDHGRGPDGIVSIWGTNSRLDNLQAAILNFKLKFYPQEIDRRREIAHLYHHHLKSLENLVLPPSPEENKDHFDVYQNYELEAEGRDDLRNYLKEQGVHTFIQWSGQPIHQFKKLGFSMCLPKTESFFKRCLMLPLNTALTDEDVYYVIETIHKFYQERNRG